MQCKEIDNLIMKYLDGNISELEMEQIIKHKDKCTRCNMEFELLRDAIDIIEEMPEIEVPDGFEVRVMNTIKNTKPQALSVRAMLLWILGLAGLTVFMFNILSLFVIPSIKSSGIEIIIVNMYVYVSTLIVNMIEDFLLGASLLISKILISKDVFFRQILLLLIVSLGLLVSLNVTLARRLKIQQK